MPDGCAGRTRTVCITGVYLSPWSADAWGNRQALEPKNTSRIRSGPRTCLGGRDSALPRRTGTTRAWEGMGARRWVGPPRPAHGPGGEASPHNPAPPAQPAAGRKPKEPPAQPASAPGGGAAKQRRGKAGISAGERLVLTNGRCYSALLSTKRRSIAPGGVALGWSGSRREYPLRQALSYKSTRLNMKY